MELVIDHKKYFPIYAKHKELVYLDNAATTQRHVQVLQTLNRFNREANANIHRGVYNLSNNATDRYEEVRKQAASFLGSNNPSTVAFTSGTTESINIIASSFLDARLFSGDNIVTTQMEHHANFIPWQMLATRKEASLRVCPVRETGDLDYGALGALLDHNTRLLAVTHISNTMGTINDLKRIIEMAHEKNIPVLVDAAQSAAYYALDSSTLDYDFLVFSGHKMFGPFGTGILYAREKWHAHIAPFLLGGGIIEEVSIEHTTFKKYPFHLDAGTPNVAGIIGLGEAFKFLEEIDRPSVVQYMNELATYTRLQLDRIPSIQVVGNPAHYSGIVSFNVAGIHPHDVASYLNRDNIAVRAGMHCTQPLLTALNLTATVRVSFALYNSKEEIDYLIQSLKSLIAFWS